MKSYLPQKIKRFVYNVSGIIADDNTINDPIEIAENFNNFFVYINRCKPSKNKPSY